MGRIPQQLREIIAKNIRECRSKKFPGRGGGKRCAEAFGVSPQQWSPWEHGMRTPDEVRLDELAKFFEVTVEYLRADHSQPPPASQNTASEPPRQTIEPSLGMCELLENSYKLVWLVTALQNEALLGRRGYAQIIEVMRQARLYLEGKLW